MKWSNEMIDVLKSLAKLGTANKVIAEQFGVPVGKIYAKRSQLGITIDKVKAAGIVNPAFEAALPNKAPKNRFFLFIWTLGRLLKLADESIEDVDLTSEGKTVTITYKKGGFRMANIECDSQLAIIADVVRACLK